MENQNQQVPENLTPQQALAILVQGVQFGQSKGIYSLTDAELISKAVRVFTPPAEEAPVEAGDSAITDSAAPVMESVSEPEQAEAPTTPAAE